MDEMGLVFFGGFVLIFRVAEFRQSERGGSELRHRKKYGEFTEV